MPAKFKTISAVKPENSFYYPAELVEYFGMQARSESLQALPYHAELRNYLKEQEPALWQWFSSAQAKMEYTESLRLELLKSTYRLDAGSHPELYRATEEAKVKLGLEIPVTVYQAQHMTELNAALFYIPGEGHVVLSGPALSLLTYEEFKAVLGHELAHYRLWQADAGEFLVADRLLQAVAHDHRAESSHVQSARWFQLYTEIYADRGSLIACENIEAAVAGLVKMMTGLQHVSGASYVKQAEEVFQQSKVKTSALSHPEAFIRARALQLWAAEEPEIDQMVREMIEGAASFDDLDLLGQAELTATTRQFLEAYLQPKWFQTGAVLGHAKLFFDDFKAGKNDKFDARISEPRLKDYFCFLMLDFAAVDPELDQLPLAAAFQWSKRLEIEAEFEKLAVKELKLKARAITKLKNEAEELLLKAEENE